MHVDHAESRKVQQAVGKKLTVGCDHTEIRFKSLKGCDEVRICHPFWLEHRQVVGLSDYLYRRR